MSQEYMHTLETLIDNLSLAAILEMQERICHKKAEDLRNNWQDEASAKLWEKAARQIEQLNVDV
jgi:hypothetical protein